MIQLKWSVSFICQTIFGWVSMIVYGLIIWTLITHRKQFHGSYYKLYLFSSSLNVVFYINSWPMMRLINNVCKECTFSSFFKQKTFVGLDTLRFLHVYFHHAVICLEIVMSINRYTAIVNPLKYHKLWNKILLPTRIVVLLIPIALSYPSYIYPTYIIYNEVFDVYFYTGTENQLRRYATLTAMQGTAFFTFLIMGVASLCAISRIGGNSSAHRRVEMNLYVHCTIVSSIKMVFFIHGLLWIFHRELFATINAISVIEYCLLFVQCVDPWVLLFCCRELRRQTPLFRLIPSFRKSKGTVVNISSALSI